MYKKNNQGKVNLIDKEIRFLEELVVSEEEIFEKSKEITSLIEIQRKQNIRHGLTNVTDACFEFFIEMDKKIRDLETLNNLTLYTSNIYSFISAEISESESINEKWRALFTENENFNIISSLFHEILSSNQFIRECNQRFAAEKEKAHRKQVMQKKSKSFGQKKHGPLKSVFQITQLEKCPRIGIFKVCLNLTSHFLLAVYYKKGTWFCYARLLVFKVLNLKQNLHYQIS